MTGGRSRPAVVLGLSPTGLHVVRSLGKAGVPVIGVSEPGQPGRFSRYLQRCITADQPAERLDALLKLFPETAVTNAAKPVLIPTSDQDVDLVIENAATLRRSYVFQTSYDDGVAQQILSKDRFYRLCDSHGIPYPKMWVAELDAMDDLASTITFPCLIKPAEIHQIKREMGGRKLWVAENLEAFRNIIGTIPRTTGTLVIQEIVPGPESEITLCCVHVTADGAMRQMFTGRKLRQFPPGFGSASLVQSTPDYETEQISREFLKQIGYHGIAALEFKRHCVTGELIMIEVNARPSLWFSITERAGKSVVLSSYLELSGEAELPAEVEQIDGVRWRYLSKDIATAIFYHRHANFVLPAPDIDVLGPAVTTVGPIFDPQDSWPVVGELLNYGRKALRRANSRRRRVGTDEAG